MMDLNFASSSSNNSIILTFEGVYAIPSHGLMRIDTALVIQADCSGLCS